MKFWNGHAYEVKLPDDEYDLKCSLKGYRESLKYFKKPKKKSRDKSKGENEKN